MKEERTLTNCKRIGNHLILLDKLLGSGHYGKVYLSYEISQTDDKSLLMNKPLACKIIEREKLSATAHKQVQNEVEVLSEVKSDNVIFMNTDSDKIVSYTQRPLLRRRNDFYKLQEHKQSKSSQLSVDF
ncbi:protein kinase domain containing protein [Stylonychia lemnae]|uniref:Protein kinase domain containing protein n=1 Tax=Stylonychia lemnae TaxID=5949 RepID=A0A078AIL7_STYLE|nr:protein kinase domain containing protein [Stylonychia lemnae]|eukprot:CDW82064.1 protein kinase domain containing protein [Stylonychia lemnae]